MSVASFGLKQVGVIAGEYNAPQIKVSKQGQITYINDLNPDGGLTPEALQEQYDELEAIYIADLAIYNSVIDPTTGIPYYETILTDDVDDLNTASASITTASTNLTTALSGYTTFNYLEYTLMSNQLKLNPGYPTDNYWVFSNDTSNPSQQQPITIYSGFGVLAGTYLMSGYLSCSVEGGDTDKINNAGSSCIMIISNASSGSTLAVFQSGTATEFSQVYENARNAVSGQQLITFTSNTSINISFYCSVGAVVGQPSYVETPLGWVIQPFANIGSGQNDVAGQTTPTQYYKCLSFQKI